MAEQQKTTKKKVQSLKLPVPNGILLAIGGKESKSEETRTESQEENTSFISEQILKRFVKELKCHNPLILVVPAASGEPTSGGKEYTKLFKDLGG